MLVGCWKLKRPQLAFEQRARHEVPRPGSEARRDQGGRSMQEHETNTWRAATETIAVASLQCRARDDQTGREPVAGGELGGNAVEPRPTVLVRQGDSRFHL